jgi:hypothetical protein
MAVSLIAASVLIIGAILFQSFSSIKASERIAIDALGELQEKNLYIAATAQKVAPDYLDLMGQQEKNYQFADAEQALDTGLAFDPSLAQGWMWKGKMLLCQQNFSEAWNILSGSHGHPVKSDPAALRLAEKYKDAGPVPDSGIPQLVRDFKSYNLAGGIPRLFYHLNRTPFDPETRFPAIAEALRVLNPGTGEITLTWNEANSGGWIISLGKHPDLNDISPLCGLDIRILNASHIGTPDLNLITESDMIELRLAGTQLNHLFVLDQFAGLKVLDISQTQIRNISNLVKYPKLSALNISGIEDLTISPQLRWCRNLKMLTVSGSFRDDPTIRSLAQRGVIIIYSDK